MELAPPPDLVGAQRRRSVHFDPMASTILTVPGPEDEGTHYPNRITSKGSHFPYENNSGFFLHSILSNLLLHLWLNAKEGKATPFIFAFVILGTRILDCMSYQKCFRSSILI